MSGPDAIAPVRFRVDRHEHARAVDAIRGGRAMMRLLPLVGWFAVLSVLANVVESAGSGTINPLTLVALVPAGAFLGAAKWRGRRVGVLQWSFSEAGVAIDGRPRPLRIRWEDVRKAEETPEFFLLRTDGLGCYLPKRALSGREAEIRSLLLDRLGERAHVGKASP